MTFEVHINNSADPKARYLTWAPTPCRIRLSDPSGVATPTVTVQLTSQSVAGGGAIDFRATPTSAPTTTLSLQLPINGTFISFLVSGRFGRPSVADHDVRLLARVGSVVVADVPVMVRIRKNANSMTAAERDRFIAAFAQLNNQGAGRFADFRAMHTEASSPQAHGAPGFLPWHRAYLLDLERELQAIDSSVTLPYWRFDRPAPQLFSLDFFGVSDDLGTVHFSNTNPLQFWVTDGVQGINRRPFFNTSTAGPNVLTESQTLGLGNAYAAFRGMEINPHGFAHTSFGGSVSSIDTAAKDPLFFLLHCNVDRLWAKWQRQFGRFDPAKPTSFDGDGANPVGHNLGDTMWPWNGVTGGSRPPTAPGGPMLGSPAADAPGPQPHVRDSLDYQGAVNSLSRLGFDYDDVRFN